MRARVFLLLATLALALLVAGCSGDSETAPPATSGAETQGGTDTEAPPPDTETEPAETETGEIVKGGILRIGTINDIDSLNPFNYIEAQAYQAFIMLLPQLVQYEYTTEAGYQLVGDWATSWETSPDGLDWTFHLVPGTAWSDGTPMTADDAAWTINTTVKYADGPTAVMAPSVNHVESAEAIDDKTLVIHYRQPVGNALEQLEQFFVVPRHVYEPLEQQDPKELKRFKPEQNLPMVTGGAFTLKQYESKGTNVFVPDPNYWGEPANAEAVALIYYTNSDSMIADLQAGELDWVDQVPFNAVDVLKADENLTVNEVPGAETTNITWNSNPHKQTNVELLDPRVKKALSMCIDREKIIEVVFNGYATTVESLPGHISNLENPDLGPLVHDCAEGNRMLDELGYARGADGIRIVPATTGENAQPEHPMEYEIVTPTGVDFNIDRSFQIVQEGFAEAGVRVTQRVGGDSTATYAIQTGDDCDPATSTGYQGWDIAMWDWVGYIDPDFMLSVVTKGQWCSWSDTGWDNPEYDAMYAKQGATIDPDERKAIVYEMQQAIYDNVLYTQLTNHVMLDAHSNTWGGITPELTNLAAYSKYYWTRPGMLGG
ncbi:MAG: ABC transporter substrate-binding protein [Thermoleophilia bacterium]|nr:ABC transporter substrate-binding protein [Thermoleophilia bacterium]